MFGIYRERFKNREMPRRLLEFELGEVDAKRVQLKETLGNSIPPSCDRPQKLALFWQHGRRQGSCCFVVFSANMPRAGDQSPRISGRSVPQVYGASRKPSRRTPA